ncbi:MAG: Calx-beta domain-containing protein [Patescibacteria group bacterium]
MNRIFSTVPQWTRWLLALVLIFTGIVLTQAHVTQAETEVVDDVSRPPGITVCYNATTAWGGGVDIYTRIPTTMEVIWQGPDLDTMLVRVVSTVPDDESLPSLRHGMEIAGTYVPPQGTLPFTATMEVASHQPDSTGVETVSPYSRVVSFASWSTPDPGRYVSLWQLKWQPGTEDKNLFVYFSTGSTAGTWGWGASCPPRLQSTGDAELTFNFDSLSVSEADVPRVVVVKLLRSGNLTSAFSVQISIDGLAEEGQDINLPDGLDKGLVTLNFEPGETEKSWLVNILDDNVYEPTEGLQFILKQATGVSITGKGRLEITIEDDDPLPTATPEPTASPTAVPTAEPDPKPDPGDDPSTNYEIFIPLLAR